MFRKVKEYFFENLIEYPPKSGYLIIYIKTYSSKFTTLFLKGC